MTVATRFDRHPRVRLLEAPTPIQRLRRVEVALGLALKGARLFVKRDDLTGLGGGGSKLRKLEFLLVKLKVRDIRDGEQVAACAIVMQQKTQRPVQLEITPATRDTVLGHDASVDVVPGTGRCTSVSAPKGRPRVSSEAVIAQPCMSDVGRGPQERQVSSSAPACEPRSSGSTPSQSSPPK